MVGDSRCPIVDTWWQTETGAHMITNLPGAFPMRPGSASLPFFGVEPAVVDEKGWCMWQLLVSSVQEWMVGRQLHPAAPLRCD